MPVDRTETAMMCQFYAASGISPVVRVPRPEEQWATMALDGGAEGIVVPYVETEEEVRRMVGAVKFRPIKGRMLREILDGRRDAKPQTREYLDTFNRHNYLIIGVESVAAYENLDALIGCPGVDGVFIGPHDMSVTMEIPERYDHPEFLRVVTDIIRRCRDAGVGVGLHLGPAIASDDRFHELMDAGMNWVIYGADISLLKTEMSKRLAAFRERMGDVYRPGIPPPPAGSSCLERRESERGTQD
jgi:4-hydroxy-2-oxoheptanedioate aldolase